MYKKITTSGPIATKLIRDVLHFKKQKIIQLSAIRDAKEYMNGISESKKKTNLDHLDPLHAMYSYAQHRIVDFFEQFSLCSYSEKFCLVHEASEDIYMPSGPPMSPVTKSFYTCWFTLDMKVGVKKETVTTIMIDLYRALDVDKTFLQVLELMQASYTGLYVCENSDDNFVYLREIYTGKVHKTLVTSAYKGIPGETWLVRLLPSPWPHLTDYSITFTTPYIIMKFPLGKPASHIARYSDAEWLAFIERNLSKIKVKKGQNAYTQFMKYGLDKYYWLEYVTLAYVNCTENMILLTGLPDEPEELPHHPTNADKFARNFD